MRDAGRQTLRVFIGLVAVVLATTAQAVNYEGYRPVVNAVPEGEGMWQGFAIGESLKHPNLLKNPSFDDGLASWTMSSSSGMNPVVLTSGTGIRYLRIDKTTPNVVYVAQQRTYADGNTLGDAYINGAALVQGTPGEEGVISLVIESSKIQPAVERKLRFNYADDQWNLVRFNLPQDFRGHTNVKLTFRYYPKQMGYQRLDEVFLEAIPALPAGVPVTTRDKDACFLDGEIAAVEAGFDRVEVSGCTAPIIAPQTTVESYPPYLNDGQTYNCRTLRANVAHTHFIDRFQEDLTAKADKTDRNPGAEGVLCVANMIYYWASRGAMTRISPYGTPNTSLLERTWAFGTIGATYLKNPHVRERMRGMGSKDAAVLSWMRTIAPEISKEIDEVRAAGQEANTQYWRAHAILPAALLTQDLALLRNSRRVFIDAMLAIEHGDVDERDKGFLVNELARGTRAITYHGFAATPLYGMALYSQAYGCNFVDNNWREDQFARLTRKTIQGKYEPEVFSAAMKHYFPTEPEKWVPASEIGPSDYRSLMYLADTLHPSISANVADFILAETGRTVSRTEGFDKGNTRIGGLYARLRESLPLLRPLNPGALAADCPY